MISVLTLASAFAADPVGLAKSELSAHDGAVAATTCSRFDAGAPVFALWLKATPVAGPLGALFDPLLGAPGDRGIDAAAPVALSFDKRVRSVRLGFLGTEAQADALVRSVDPAATGSAGHWDLKDGYRADLRDGALTFARDAEGTNEAGRKFAAHPLPAADGCAVVVDVDPVGDKPPLRVAGFVPYRGGGAGVTFVDAAKPAPAWMSRTDADLPGATLDMPGDIVITITAPLEDVIADLTEEKLAETFGPALAAARHQARFPAGVAVVFQGNPKKGGNFAAMTTVTDPNGKPFPRGRFVGALVEGLADKESARIDKSTLSFVDKGKTSYIGVAKDGRVILTSSLDVARGAFDQEGQPWAKADVVARARMAPVAVTASDASTGMTLWATAAAADGAVRLDGQLQMEPAARAQLLAMGQMMAPMLGASVTMGLERVKAAAGAVEGAQAAPEAP